MASSDGGRPAREATGLLATIIAIVQTLLGALLGINLPPQGAGAGGSRQGKQGGEGFVFTPGGADRGDSDADADADADADTEDEVTPLMDPFEELGLDPKGAGGCGVCHTVSRSGCMGYACWPVLSLCLVRLNIYHTIPYKPLPYHTIPYHTIPYTPIPYHTIPYHTIPYHTSPFPIHTYHTIPYHTPLAIPFPFPLCTHVSLVRPTHRATWYDLIPPATPSRLLYALIQPATPSWLLYAKEQVSPARW